jgi:hypothetical protein
MPSIKTDHAASFDLSALPRFVSRKHGAELVSFYFFPVSHRTIERWSIAGRVVNGRLVLPTADLFALAQQKIDAAPVR